MKKIFIGGNRASGKSTLLRSLVSSEHEGVKILEKVRVGYYSQDF